MDLKEVKQFLKENAEKDDVKAYLAEFKTDESKIIEDYKKSQDFKSELDRSNTKAIETYTSKTVPKLIEEKVKEKESELELKYNPPKDPTIEALKNQIEQMKKANEEKEAEANKLSRMNFLYENVKPEYKPFLKLMDGSLETDKDAVDYLNKTAYDFSLIQKTGKPTSGDSSQSGQLTLEEFRALPKEAQMQAEKDGKCDKILGRI